jgi:micrococcal nuclease
VPWYAVRLAVALLACGCVLGCSAAGDGAAQRSATPTQLPRAAETGAAGEPTPPLDAFWAVVDRVVDGDTLIATVEGQQTRLRVRVIGVDTPETVKRDSPPECFGPEASAYAERLVAGQRVRAAYQGTARRDRFDRELWDVWLADGAFFAGLLVDGGYATATTIRPQVRHAAHLARRAKAAQRAGRGLWGPPCEGRP